MTTLGLAYGGWGDRRLEFDVARAKLAPGLSVRLTGAIEGSESFRDQQFLDRKAVAGGLLLEPTESTRILLQADYLFDRRVTDFGIPAFRGRPVEVDPSTYYGAANARDVDFSRSEVWSTTAVFEHRFSHTLSLRNGFRHYDYQLDRNNTLPAAVNETTRTVSLNRSNVEREERGWTNQLELSQDLTLGARHQLLYGLEVFGQTKDQRFNTRTAVATVDLFKPVSPVLPLRLGGAPQTNNIGKFGGYAAYVQDLLSIGDQWKALVGVRYDHFAQETLQRVAGLRYLSRTDTAWSPRAGLVWEPRQGQSYYLAWSRSFQPSGEAFAIAANNADVAPEETTNREVGAKLRLLGGRLKATASAYELTRTGIKSVDPSNPQKLIPIGEQRTRGVEFSGAFDVSPGWHGLVTYAHMDARVIRSTARDAGLNVQGKRATLTPQNSANIWVTRDISDTFGLGGGISYVGERFANPGNTVVLPAYTTLDLVGWKRTGAMTWQINIYNVTDQRYVVSGHGASPNLNIPGAPRSARLSLRVSY